MTADHSNQILAMLRTDLASHRKMQKQLVDILSDQRIATTDLTALVLLLRQDLVAHSDAARRTLDILARIAELLERKSV